MPAKPTNFDEYLARVTSEQREALEKLRKTIRAAAPDAEECISYQICAFRQKRMLVGFGASTKHCTFYLMSGAILDGFKAEVKGFKTSKGAIQFTPEKPVPAALVRKLVKARLAENAAMDA